MARSDDDFAMLAAADLVASLLRNDDRFHLVSAGVEANVVLEGSGGDRVELGSALRRLHREASSTDYASVFHLLKDIFDEDPPLEGKPIVFWFTGRHFGFDATSEDYYPTDDLRAAWIGAKQSEGFAKDPLKVKQLKNVLPKVMVRLDEIVGGEASWLGDRGVPVHIFVAGPGIDGPQSAAGTAGDILSRAAALTGGSYFTTAAGGGPGVMDSVLSAFIRSINAPTLTVDETSMVPSGDSFEVFRSSRHFWVVVLFQNPPSGISLNAAETGIGSLTDWPFGKPPEDVYAVEPHVEKGLDYKQKRWFKLPEHPVGFASFSVHDPQPGNYRIQVKFAKGDPFVLRVFQDVDLEYGFLETPAHSIPLGMDFVAVAALRHPEGYSYVFSRAFLDGLEFQVVVRKADGKIPEWGEVRSLEASREGETLIDLEPAEPGTYYLKGKVSHARGEFVAFMEPFRFDVFKKIPLGFDVKRMEWSSSGGQGWTSLDPPLRVAGGIQIPPGVTFRIRVDTRGVTGWELLEFEPGESFVVSRSRPEVRFRVRLKEPGAGSYGRFTGRIRLTVEESQRQSVEGGGAWEIPIEGRFGPIGIESLTVKYRVALAIALAALLAALLLVERLRRPAFPAGLQFWFMDEIGGKQRTWTLPVGSRPKPILPFVRQKIVVGRGGDAGLYREDVLCVVRPTRRGIRIHPRASGVMELVPGGAMTERARPFVAAIGPRYRAGGSDGHLEFWFALDGGGSPIGKAD